MVVMGILQGLTMSKGHDLLLEEGYIKGKCIEKDDISCERLFLYPYTLNDSQGKVIDCIYWAEYCNHVVDDEYIDGRMTWEDIRANWVREL